MHRVLINLASYTGFDSLGEVIKVTLLDSFLLKPSHFKKRFNLQTIGCVACNPAWGLFLVSCCCCLVLLFCLSFNACRSPRRWLKAQCPSSHSWRLQSEPCKSSSLMAIHRERRLYKHVGPVLVMAQDTEGGYQLLACASCYRD